MGLVKVCQKKLKNKMKVDCFASVMMKIMTIVMIMVVTKRKIMLMLTDGEQKWLD